MQIKINEYDTIETGRYNGKWQIKAGRVKDGKFYPDFKQIKKKDGSMINVPVSLTFDSENDRLVFLEMLAGEAGYDLVEKTATPQPPADDVPF